MGDLRLKYSKLYFDDNSNAIKLDVFGSYLKEVGGGYDKVVPSDYSSIYDLPKAAHGYTETYNWDCRFKELIEFESIEKISDKICALFDKHPSCIDIIFGGGDPLSRQSKIVRILKNIIKTVDLCSVTFETDAIIPLKNDLTAFISKSDISFKFICKPKLRRTGVSRIRALMTDAFDSYYVINDAGNCTAVEMKFIAINKKDDICEIEEFMNRYLGDYSFYYGNIENLKAVEIPVTIE